MASQTKADLKEKIKILTVSNEYHKRKLDEVELLAKRLAGENKEPRNYVELLQAKVDLLSKMNKATADEYADKIFKTPEEKRHLLSNYGLSKRLLNAFQRDGTLFVEELIIRYRNRKELEKLRNIGEKSIDSLIEILEANGFDMKQYKEK